MWSIWMERNPNMRIRLYDPNSSMPGSNYGVISSSPLTFQANGRYLTLVSGFTYCAGAILSDPSNEFQNGMDLNLKWHVYIYFLILRLSRALNITA